jgi:hypothetical protein
MTLKRMVSSGLLRRVALVRTDVSEEPGASFIRVTKIGELGTPFFIVTAVKTSNLTITLKLPVHLTKHHAVKTCSLMYH